MEIPAPTPKSPPPADDLDSQTPPPPAPPPAPVPPFPPPPLPPPSPTFPPTSLPPAPPTVPPTIPSAPVPSVVEGPLPSGGFARPSLPPLPTAPPPPQPPVILPPVGGGPGLSALEQARNIVRPLAILGFLAFLIIVGISFFGSNLACLPYVGQFLGTCQRDVSLTYWGIWEDAAVVNPLLADFVATYEAQNPNVELTINYEKRAFSTLDQYKDTLKTRLAEGTGPDVVRVHNSWVSGLTGELAPLPANVLSEADYTSRFYPVVLASAKSGEELFAIPLEYDGIVLFYNKGMFEGIDVASELSTWEGFRRQAVRLTTWEDNDPGKKILQSGAAFGTANNVSHSPDLFSLLLVQSGVDPLTQLATPAAADALTFYANFSKTDRVWDETLPFSVNAFANGQVAMIFGPSWRALEIKSLNPQLDFVAVPVPQLAGVVEGGIHWGSFWMEGVSRDSREPEIAWRLLEFLTQEEQQRAFFSAASVFRAFGEPYSLRSLAPSLADDPLLAPLLAGAPGAKTGKTVDFSGNDPYAAAFKQAISDVLAGKSATEALETAQATINQLEGKSPSQ